MISEASSAFGAPGIVQRPGVLRFAAYSSEAIETSSSSAETSDNIRKFFILYHLEDDTVEVVEERVMNSGQTGGIFFSRAAIDGVEPKRLLVGGTLQIIGRDFHLVDADGFTRRFFEQELHVKQPEFTGYPASCPEEYRAEHATRMGKPNGQVAYGKSGGHEVFRKSEGTCARRGQMQKERQFYSTSGEVLVFVVVWKDESPGGEEHEYTLNFNLSTMLVELFSSPQQGYDRFVHLLANQRLPLNWDEARLDNNVEVKFAEPKDIYVGATLRVFNRTLHVVDCSEFTRQWYKQTLDYEMQPSKQTKLVTALAAEAAFTAGAAGGSPRSGACPPLRKQPLKKKQVIAAEEDCRAVNPFCSNEGPKKSSATKHIESERKSKFVDKVIRCRLRQVVTDAIRTRSPGIARALDSMPRTFVMTYFLADDELSIFEEHVVNSGVLGGAFLKRGKYDVIVEEEEEGKLPVQRAVQPCDIRLGSVLKFSANNCLEVAEVDDASLKTMAAHPEIFPFADENKILAKLKQAKESIVSSRDLKLDDDALIDTILKRSGLGDHERLTILKSERYKNQAALLQALEEDEDSDTPLPAL